RFLGLSSCFFFFQAEDGIRDFHVTGVQTCALPIFRRSNINAASNESAHTFGASFDISYVRFNRKRGRNTRLERALEKVLKQYQKQGKIYFVKERKVSCFHIVVR